MRLGSGTFAAGCVVIEVLGFALFLRGFFPAPVFSGTERQAESPAPEPSAGTTAPPAPASVSAPGALLCPYEPPLFVFFPGFPGRVSSILIPTS